MDYGNIVPTIASFLSINDESESSNSEEDENMILNIELEILRAILMIKETKGEKIIAKKLNGYIERVIPGYSRLIFKEHFRMFPETFETVLRIIGPQLHTVNNERAGKKTIPEVKQLLITIWFMATPDSYRSVATKFGVGKATAFRALRRVTYALHCASPSFIKWPKGQDIPNVIQQFQQACDFPNVIGAIDGTHIKIRAPIENANSYINQKGYHSISLQVVCNSRNLFTHCYAGQPGSIHNARVFYKSPVAEFLEYPDKYFPDDTHIIGDTGYRFHSHVMVPFRDNGHLTIQQRNFNYCLLSTGIAVKKAIKQLKFRFRVLLDCLPLTDLKKIPEFIIACCVLHNICILQNDEMPVDIICEHNNQNPIVYGDIVNVAIIEKRNRIMNALPIRIK